MKARGVGVRHPPRRLAARPSGSRGSPAACCAAEPASRAPSAWTGARDLPRRRASRSGPGGSAPTEATDGDRDERA